MQAVIDIALEATSPLEASAEVISEQLSFIAQRLAEPEVSALALVLPKAGPDHDDWRRTLARDLARAHAPKRVNVVSAGDQQAELETLAYLRDAPGVTGQYLQTHE